MPVMWQTNVHQGDSSCLDVPVVLCGPDLSKLGRHVAPFCLPPLATNIYRHFFTARVRYFKVQCIDLTPCLTFSSCFVSH